jgi:hypothetical protein
MARIAAKVYTTDPRNGVNCRTHTSSIAMLTRPVRKSHTSSIGCRAPSTAVAILSGTCVLASGSLREEETAKAQTASSTLNAAATYSVRRNPRSSMSTNPAASVPAAAPRTLAR